MRVPAETSKTLAVEEAARVVVERYFKEPIVKYYGKSARGFPARIDWVTKRDKGFVFEHRGREDKSIAYLDRKGGVYMAVSKYLELWRWKKRGWCPIYVVTTLEGIMFVYLISINPDHREPSKRAIVREAQDRELCIMIPSHQFYKI